jgi:serine/threonine protein kinase
MHSAATSCLLCLSTLSESLDTETVCSDAAHGLRHIHAHNIIHLDIKPENIYLHASAVFKIGDFGLAIVATGNAHWEDGDGRYLAPELLQRASRPTAAADVYSLAASLLHCALGVHQSWQLPLEWGDDSTSHSVSGKGNVGTGLQQLWR